MRYYELTNENIIQRLRCIEEIASKLPEDIHVQSIYFGDSEERTQVFCLKSGGRGDYMPEIRKALELDGDIKRKEHNGSIHTYMHVVSDIWVSGCYTPVKEE